MFEVLFLQVARTHGILLDPIYSLAAWEVAVELAGGRAVEGSTKALSGSGPVAMLHCGGALGLHGLAQRYPNDF